MTLYHYSSSLFTLDARVFAQEQVPTHKPKGLWLSVDDGWEEWCREEEFNIDGLTYKTEVLLANDANILSLSTPEALDTFTTAYEGSCLGISWHEVARKYHGIIIAPYQ